MISWSYAGTVDSTGKVEGDIYAADGEATPFPSDSANAADSVATLAPSAPVASSSVLTVPSVSKTPSATGTPYSITSTTSVPSADTVGTSQMQTDSSSQTKTSTVKKPRKVVVAVAKNNKTKLISITWKKVSSATGYQIQCALNQKFTKGRKTKSTIKAQYTLRKLKRKKTYYFRVRAYTNSGTKKLYGEWSKVKKVKVKK